VLHVLSSRVLHYCRDLLISTAVNKCKYCKYLHKTRHHSRMRNSNLTPPVFSAPTGGDSVGISGRCLMLIKLEWLEWSYGEKIW